MSIMDISKELNIGHMIIYRGLIGAGVNRRTDKEGIALAYLKRRGPQNANFKGERKTTRGRHKKYWLIYKPEHNRADKRGFVYEHIYVWEQANGKPVPKGWHVHHKNGVASDNRLENLEAMTSSKHTKVHNDMRAKELEDAKVRIKELEAETKELKDRLSQMSTINPLN